MMKKSKGIAGKKSNLQLSEDSLLTETLYVHIDGVLIRNEEEPISSNSTINYLKILSKVDPSLDVSELTKLKAITIPATPKYNEEKDNMNHDLILYSDAIIEPPKCLTPSKCKKSQTKYKVINLLGQGSFGQVVKCLDLTTKQFVALKVLRNRLAYFRQGMLEIAVLQLLNEKFDIDGKGNTVRLFDHFLYYNHVCIVTELLGINIYELMKQNGCRGFGLNVSRTFISQILESLNILYNNNIIHCDLKPENILLVDYTKQIKLIDFGSACFENNTLYTYIQSRHYRAPEVILGLPYSTSIDMWSLGCITAEFFLGIPIFPGNSEYNQLYKIISMIGPPPTEMLETATKATKYFRKRKGLNGRIIYEFKTKSEFEYDNGVVIESNREYFDYTSLEDFCNRVPLRVSAKDEPRKVEYRKAFYDFLRRILVWNPHQRLRPIQALHHPFITREIFNGSFEVPRCVSPLREHPPSSIQSIDDTLMALYPNPVIAQSQKIRSFSPTSYYELYLNALNNGIVLNIQNSNPFSHVPMTPPVLEQMIADQKLKEHFDQIRRNASSVDTIKKFPDELVVQQYDDINTQSLNHMDKEKHRTKRIITGFNSNNIATSVGSTSFIENNKTNQNTMDYNSDIAKSWSKTTEMRIPDSTNDGNIINKGEINHILNNINNSQTEHSLKNAQMKEKRKTSQLDQVNNEDEK
ncbi:protein kinase, putative [Entamoeba histolytica]